MKVSNRAAVPQPLGNYYDKYQSKHPVERFLLERFKAKLVDLAVSARPGSVLDVGCGQGEVSGWLQERLPSALFIGTDVEPLFLQEGARERIGRVVANALPDLCFRPRSFDLVVLSEVLEHLEDPRAAIDALCRVPRRALLVTVPHEPVWRFGNMLRMRYLSDLGNTPGHIQHFSPGKLARLLRTRFTHVRVYRSTPWLLAYCTGAVQPDASQTAMERA